MSFRLQISLECCDHQNNQVRVGIDKQRTSQVADALYQQVFRLGQIYCVNVAKRCVVSQHLNVECSYKQLLHFLLRQVTFEELSLQ